MRIEAEVTDSTHLVLQEPLEIPVGSKLVLEVLSPESAAEHDEFLTASSALLERAYAADEPDYSTAGEPLNSQQ